MKNNKKIKLLALAASLLVCGTLMTSCSNHIKDTNGPDDFSLVELTEEDLLAGSITAHVTNTDGVKDEGNGVTSYTDSKITGVKAIASYDVNNDEFDGEGRIKVTVDSEVRAGNVEIALVNRTRKTIESYVNIGEGQTVDVDNSYGNYELRIAAESADLDIKVKFEFIPTEQ